MSLIYLVNYWCNFMWEFSDKLVTGTVPHWSSTLSNCYPFQQNTDHHVGLVRCWVVASHSCCTAACLSGIKLGGSCSFRTSAPVLKLWPQITVHRGPIYVPSPWVAKEFWITFLFQLQRLVGFFGGGGGGRLSGVLSFFGGLGNKSKTGGLPFQPTQNKLPEIAPELCTTCCARQKYPY